MLKRLTALLICTVMLFPCVLVNAAEKYNKADISKVIDEIMSYKSSLMGAGDTEALVQKLSEKTDSPETQWYIISLSKYGEDVTAVQESMEKSAEKLYEKNSKATDFQRTVLALYACGLNPENINGKNLLGDGTYNSDKVNSQGINAYAYALMALDCAGAVVPSDAEYGREYFIKKIIGLQLSDGGFSLSGKSADTDMTAICVQALAPYKADSAVSSALDRALNILSEKQDENGGYSSYGTVNCESTAQVISALIALDVDIQTDSRFIKNGNNLIDNLLSYKNSDGGFAHIQGGKSNNIASYQALKALVDFNMYLSTGTTDVFGFEDTSNSDSDSENNQVGNNGSSEVSAVVIDSNSQNNSVNTGDITGKQESGAADENSSENVKETSAQQSEAEFNQSINSPNDTYKPFVLESTPDSAAANNSETNNMIYYISLAGLIIVAVTLLIFKLTVLKRDGEPFRLFGRKKGGK